MKLKLYNGRWFEGKRIYICAKSRADAARMLTEYKGYCRGWSDEIKNFYSECWGNSMSGIRPERGLWISDGYRDTPKKVFTPKETK